MNVEKAIKKQVKYLGSISTTLDALAFIMLTIGFFLIVACIKYLMS